MKVTINKEVFKKYPELKVVFIHTQNSDNISRLKEARNLIDDVESLVHMTFNKATIKTHHLISPWVVAQMEFGKRA